MFSYNQCFDETEMAEVWRNHMEGIMNVENEWDGIVDAQAVEGPVKCVEVEEIESDK